MGDVSWLFLLVNSGIEHIRIVNNDRVKFEGRVPAGFSRHLVIGDAVLVKLPKLNWQTKFRLVLHEGALSLQFGTAYGDPRKFITLKHFSRVSQKIKGVVANTGDQDG